MLLVGKMAAIRWVINIFDGPQIVQTVLSFRHRHFGLRFAPGLYGAAANSVLVRFGANSRTNKI